MVEDLADFTLLVFFFKYHQVKFIKFSPLFFIAEDRGCSNSTEDFWNKKRIKNSSLIFREYWSGICIFQYLEKRLDLILLQKSCSKSSPGFWESLSVFTKKSILTAGRRKNYNFLLCQNSGTSVAKLLKIFVLVSQP